MNYLALGITFVILIILIFMSMIIHQALLNMLWYRWLINSIIFPYTYYKIVKRIKKMDDETKAVEMAIFTGANYWFSGCWFGRVIKNKWIKEVSKIDELTINNSGYVSPQIHIKDFPLMKDKLN